MDWPGKRGLACGHLALSSFLFVPILFWPISPWLFGRLFTVSALPINAFLIDTFAMPIAEKDLSAELLKFGDIASVAVTLVVMIWLHTQERLPEQT